MTDTDTETQAPNEPQTFSVEYVRELRAESKNYRLRALELEQAAKTAADAANNATSEAEAKVVKANEAAEQRIIRAELKAIALKHGMVDADGLKLLDLSDVKLSPDGEITGGDDLITAAKKDKPWLFSVASTSSTATAPKPTPPSQKSALDLSDEDFQAARRRIDAGGRI